MDAQPFGKLVWFNPDSEEPSLRALTAEEKADRVDMVSSVSGLDEDEDTVPSYLQNDLPF